MRNSKSKTRKISKKNTVYLHHLHKTKGGRIENMTSFKPVCSAEGAHAKLIGVKSLKTPDEADEFIHVIKSAMDDKELVVKVQEPGHMLSMELTIHKLLQGCNNIINYICDFECLFDNVIWNKPINTPRYFCDTSGDKLHLIVMEYINNDLAEYLGANEIDKIIFDSIVKQSGFAMLNFHINYNVCHNDINRGNILLDIGDAKELTYTINNNTVTIDTHGYEIVYIDFQRGNIIEVNDYNIGNTVYNTNNNFNIYNANISSANVLFQFARDELALLYELLSKWTKNKEYKILLQKLMNNIMECETTDTLFELIDKFTVV